MASERDQAGQAGSGLTGAGRDTAGMNAGTSGSAAMGDRGTGQVHSGLHSGGGDQYEGLAFAGSEGGSGSGGLRGKASGAASSARDAVGSAGSKASGAASAATGRLGGVREKAHHVLEERGLLDRIRDNPLPVLGVAFALGFLLAARDDDDDFGESRRGRARSELRDALMAGVTAGLAQGARGFLNQAGSESTGFVNTLMDAFLGGGSSGGGGSARSGGGSTGGGSTSGISRVNRGGSAGGATGGSTGRSGATSRPPSHQEY